MPTTLGPHFGNELAAAGLAGLDIAWIPATAVYRLGVSLTPVQQAAFLTAYNAHDPRAAGRWFPKGRAFLQAAVGVLTAATPVVPGTPGKIARAALLCTTDPAWAAIVAICGAYDTLTAADRSFLRETWARTTQLTAGEKTAIEALAEPYGLTLP